LGYHFSKDFDKQSMQGSLMNLLSLASFFSFSREINSLWLKEIIEETIINWEKNTG